MHGQLHVNVTIGMPPFLGNSVRDRTAEFTAIAERLAKQVNIATSVG